MNKLLSAACALLLGLVAATPALAQAVTYTDVSPSGERITVPVTPSKPLPTSATVAAPSPFVPTGAAVLAVTTTTARVALPSADTTVLLTNNGAADISFKLGNGSVTAATTDYLLPAGRSIVVAAGANVDVAAITASGASSLAIITGTGTPTISGGGGAGSGGGGAVTSADGADVTQGAKADAACASAATACTVNQRLAKIEQASEDTTTLSPVKIDQTSTNNNVVVAGSVVAGSKAPGTAAASSSLSGCIFETALPTLSTTQQAAVHCDSSARLLNSDTQAQTKLDTLHTDMGLPIPPGTAIIGKVTTDGTTHGTSDLVAADITKVAGTAIVNGGVAGSLGVGGPSAANATPTENPVLVGCEFKTTTTAATTTQKQFQACGDGFGNLGKSFTPAMATQITAQSATTANTANTATLAAAASKFTYISGFACTSGGATAASLITVTVAGLITGSMTYTLAIPAGVTLAASPLVVSFPNPIQGSAVNTAITVAIGAAGSGNTVEQCNAQGFQQ